MRKRRRLADKLTIMVCAVLVAVSAFFYVPMDVNAEDFGLVSGSGSVSQLYNNNFSTLEISSNSFDLVETDLSAEQLYQLNATFRFDIVTSINSGTRSWIFKYGNVLLFSQRTDTGVSDNSKSHYFEQTVTFYAKGSQLHDKSLYCSGVLSGPAQGCSYSYEFNYTIHSITKVSSSDSEDYQNGYNAGYSAGEQAGYGNGYSNGFADGEASVDTDSIYDEAFQAGKDSVDTQSYYDAGYQAGYHVAYQEGYDSGYDEGYQSAMDRIDGWGADTTDYPVLLYDNTLSNLKLFCDVKTGYPQVAYGDYYLPQFNFNVDPNHTYKVVFNSSQYSYTSAYFSGSQRADLVYNMGSLELPWNVGESFAFVQGSSFTSNVRLQSFIYSSISDGSSSGQAVITLNSLNVKVYDYGPSGDTQNHIANQTDELTGGYNDSQGNSVNNDFSSGLNEFETAEDSLFSTATTGLKDFKFFDIQSVPAMVTGMSFVGSIMSGWFTQAGGASGVGIVLSILFSIMLVAMVLGLYRWYQSKGGKD